MGLFRSSIAALALGAVCCGAQAATLVFGAYPSTLLWFDEAKGAVTDRIPLTEGVPRSVQLSADKSKIIVTTGDHSGVEIIDAATHKVLSQFALDTPQAAEALAFANRRPHVATRYRFNGEVVDPTGRYLYATMIEMDKGLDRYTVSKPQYAVIDLEQKKVVRTRDIDDEEAQPTATSYRTSLAVSDDGKYLYMFRDKVVVLDTATLKVVDRIDLAKSEASDLEAATFGPELASIRQPGEYVSLFNETDPYIHNRLMGIGRFKLDTRQFSFTPIGPAPTTMQGLQVAPDGKTAYSVVTNGTFGNKRCELWRFDLPSNTVQDKAEFACRTRFSFGISANGQKLYIWGASFDIEVYDAKTLKHERTWDLNADVTSGNMIVIR
jgi:DNA-binding beta-propeller fold protein YncE